VFHKKRPKPIEKLDHEEETVKNAMITTVFAVMMLLFGACAKNKEGNAAFFPVLSKSYRFCHILLATHSSLHSGKLYPYLSTEP
jgi:hypothetical protein